MQIVAYKCTDTGKLFEHQADFLAHREEFVSKKVQQDRDRETIQAVRTGWAALQEQATDLVSIQDWIQTHSLALAQTCAIRNNRPPPSSNFKIHRVRLSVFWENLCSNSHSAPIDGVQNWRRDPKKPLGYPGWKGRAEFHYDGEYHGFFSSLFEVSPIHLGSGGGGTKFYGCDVVLFASEWPGLMGSQIQKALLENL